MLGPFQRACLYDECPVGRISLNGIQAAGIVRIANKNAKHNTEVFDRASRKHGFVVSWLTVIFAVSSSTFMEQVFSNAVRKLFADRPVCSNWLGRERGRKPLP